MMAVSWCSTRPSFSDLSVLGWISQKQVSEICGVCFCRPDALLSSRHHLSYDGCLDDKRENYQNSSLLCMTVMHNDAHTYEQFLDMLALGLVFAHLFRFSILCVFSGLA